VKNIIILFTVLIIFLCGAKNSLACLCGETSVCDAYSEADAILIGKVKKVIESSSDGKGNFDGHQIAFIEVLKSYKGTKRQAIKISQGNSLCDWRFNPSRVGNKYLFYLSKYANKNLYSVINCGRSRATERAMDDLSWLNKLPASRIRTRISGVVKLRANLSPLLSDIKLNIVGEKKTYEVKTKNGLYEIWDVPAGQYSILPSLTDDYQLSISASMPDNWLYFWDSDEKDMNALKVTIEPKSCGGIDFSLKRKINEK
jgi:hypothetical protein